MTIEEINDLFRQEFGAQEGKFTVLKIAPGDVEACADPDGAHAGVYVWWHSGKGALRVGRSLDNSRKRAFQHLQDNTGGIRAEVESDPGAMLLLFNVKDPKDLHWVAALEIFFETRLAPKIPSVRLG